MAKFGKKNKVKEGLENYSVCIMGESGIGKTTIMKETLEKEFGEDGYMVFDMGREDGVACIDNISYETTNTWKRFIEVVTDIIKNKDDYPELKVVVIDTLDQAIELAEKYVIAQWNNAHSADKGFRKAKQINAVEGGMGKGMDLAMESLLVVIDKLKEVGVRTWFTCHSKAKDNIDPMTGASFQVLTSNISQRYMNAIKGKIQIVGVACVDRTIEEQDTGRKNIMTKQAITINRTTGMRRKIVFRDDNYSVDSKSRFANIVDEIPLDADALIKALKDAIKLAQGKDKKSAPKPQPKVEVVEETIKKPEEEEIVEEVVEEPVEEIEEELPFTTPEESKSDDDLFAEEEKVESDYPEDLANVIPKMFKSCADKDIQAEVKALIREYGSLSKMDEEGMRKAYDLMK